MSGSADELVDGCAFASLVVLGLAFLAIAAACVAVFCGFIA